MINKIGSTGILCCFALATSFFGGCYIEHMCGDGVIAPDEACDDGNEIDGDACSSACQVEPACGDGTLDPEEPCDDGNLTNGDGCSATCEFDDLSSTPGDDRADYITCYGEAGTVTCGPDTVCCGYYAPTLCARAGECDGGPIGIVNCDGPEDCAADEQCWAQLRIVACSRQGGGTPWIECHSDADCPDPWENPCSPSGDCYGDQRKGLGSEISGDVRPGFIQCKEWQSGSTITCGPGTGCCTLGTVECVEGIEQCDGESPRFDSCDGPEDCAEPGEKCWIQSTGSGCQLEDPSVTTVRCHVHADCPQSYRNPCNGGMCVGVEEALHP